VTSADGGLRFAWRDGAVGGAYVLLLLDADMAEIARREVPGPEFTVPAGELPAAAAYAQVLVVSHGDTLARSAVAAVPPVRE
jgi:hypothetical protein